MKKFLIAPFFLVLSAHGMIMSPTGLDKAVSLPKKVLEKILGLKKTRNTTQNILDARDEDPVTDSSTDEIYCSDNEPISPDTDEDFE